MGGEGHGRFEQLAVGHVLGGLTEADAVSFRRHLRDCSDCRARVAELRGIADDLALAEREELQLARTKTQARRELDPEPWVWRPSRGWIIGAIVAVALVLAVGFWNLHLRTVNAELLAVERAQEQVVEVLATGEPLPVELSPGLRGQVRATDELVALSVVGIDPGQQGVVVIWLLGDDGPTVVPVPASAVSEGRLAWSRAFGDAGELVVSVEPTDWLADGVAEEPEGEILVRAELPITT